MCLLTFACYNAWQEVKINDHIVEYSLNGNHNAVEILRRYEKPWKLDQRIVNAALEGNEFALKVLGLTTDEVVQTKSK